MACQENVGNVVVYEACGSARYDKFGNKTRKVCSSFHPKISSLKSTKVGSKLLVCIKGEVAETRLTHLAAGSTRKTYTEDAEFSNLNL